MICDIDLESYFELCSLFDELGMWAPQVIIERMSETAIKGTTRKRIIAIRVSLEGRDNQNVVEASVKSRLVIFWTYGKKAQRTQSLRALDHRFHCQCYQSGEAL